MNDAKYKQGDILVYGDGDDERKILGICGEVYHVSCVNDFTEADDYHLTKKELDDMGYKLKSPNPELDKAIELVKQAGYKVSKICGD